LIPRDTDLLALFERWVDREDVRERILVDNPAALYGFAAASAATVASAPD
jgi:predicted TIM-barrel fold metal-dependent hydrolase